MEHIKRKRNQIHMVDLNRALNYVCGILQAGLIRDDSLFSR